jgi:glutaconate CoA-transferase subunit B
MMASVAARELGDGEVVFVGIGLPNLACNLARAMHAPNLVLIYESGAVGAVPDRLPVSIGDPALVAGSLMVASMADIFQAFLQGGNVQVGFIGGAQVDRWGNINTTVIGDFANPKVRLPGSGGASAIATNAQRTLITSKLSKRAFPERVDFVTSPGLLYPGPGSAVEGARYAPHHEAFTAPGRTREELGMPGAGPVKVITDKCVLEADEELGELVVGALYRGASLAEVQEKVGWDLKARPQLAEVEPPSERELHLMREVLDPQRLYLRS